MDDCSVKKFDICNLDVKPGDIVVIDFPCRLTTEAYNYVKHKYENEFPDLRFMVIHGGMKLSVLAKEQGALCETFRTY